MKTITREMQKKKHTVQIFFGQLYILHIRLGSSLKMEKLQYLDNGNQYEYQN